MSKFLFNLIKSMTIGEKAYFKRMSNIHSQGEGKNYIKLYKVYEQMKTYNKDLSKNQLEGTSIEKYFSSEVNYLNGKILSSLFNFKLNKSSKNKILKQILYIDVLISKGFRKEATKRLKYAKKLSYQKEEFTLILRLIELEEIILFKQGVVEFKNTLKQLDKERNKIAVNIQNLNSIRILREEIREMQFSERFITDDFKKFKSNYTFPFFENKRDCLSNKAKEHWHYIQVLKKYLIRDYHAGLLASIDYLQFMEEHYYLFDNKKMLPLLSNYLYMAALVNNKNHFDIGEKKLLKLSKDRKVDSIYLKYILYTRYLEFAYYSDDSSLMERYLSLSITLVSESNQKMGEAHLTYLFLLIIRSTIYLKKFELGAQYVNHWFQEGVSPVGKLHARLFSLIIHLEMEWNRLLHSEILLLKKLKEKFPREKKLIDAFFIFFRSVLKNPSQKGKFINELQKKLKLVSENNEANFSFKVFDFYKWSLQLDLGSKQ